MPAVSSVWCSLGDHRVRRRPVDRSGTRPTDSAALRTCVLDDHAVEEISDVIAELLEELSLLGAVSEFGRDAGDNGVQPLLLDRGERAALHTVLQEVVVHLWREQRPMGSDGHPYQQVLRSSVERRTHLLP